MLLIFGIVIGFVVAWTIAYLKDVTFILGSALEEQQRKQANSKR